MADTVIGLTFEPKVIRSKKTGKAKEDKPKEEKVTAYIYDYCLLELCQTFKTSRDYTIKSKRVDMSARLF